MKKIALVILISFSTFGYSQDLVNELNGFKLNQFREVPTTELNQPLQQKTFDDGFEFELFLVKPDSTVYMIFEYANWDKNIIWSIQLYGDDPTIDPAFKNLKMGMPKEELIKKLGEPTNAKNIGEYGEMLEYEGTNYSFEINNENRLASIKISEVYNDYFPSPKAEKIPSFNSVLNSLQSSDNEIISQILSPGLEVYKNDEVIFFKHSWRNEIENDHSGIYSLIKESIVGLDKVNLNDENEYEENMRLTLNQNIKHVLKFKKHPKIKEIVMKWEFGKFLIWEIDLI
ncbi:hypothetical protein [Robertkochia sediminum]|nr:hypothetical protein [Robertkochia sediminum]MBL7471730.1 hypothetical protein [Robertkochia sediminum]MBL7472081.1 hypothetical protein [Robertkochia sediminum]MBL7473108.1 hypothetical protein [Robertkochia sediminum]